MMRGCTEGYFDGTWFGFGGMLIIIIIGLSSSEILCGRIVGNGIDQIYGCGYTITKWLGWTVCQL